jgi:hypothetical protein
VTFKATPTSQAPAKIQGSFCRRLPGCGDQPISQIVARSTDSDGGCSQRRPRQRPQQCDAGEGQQQRQEHALENRVVEERHLHPAGSRVGDRRSAQELRAARNLRIRSAMVRTSNLSMMFARCASTVLMLMERSSAICLLRRPDAIRSRTCRSRGVRRESSVWLLSRWLNSVRRSIACSSAMATVRQKCPSSKRLLEEVDRAELHPRHCHRHVAVPGHEDEGQVLSPAQEFIVQLDAAHAVHANVEHQAGKRRGVESLQKRFRTGEGLTLKPLPSRSQRSESRTASSSSTR